MNTLRTFLLDAPEDVFNQAREKSLTTKAAVERPAPVVGIVFPRTYRRQVSNAGYFCGSLRHEAFATQSVATLSTGIGRPSGELPHAAVAMSTTESQHETRTADEPTIDQTAEQSWTVAECPTDGQLLESHHQLDSKEFECPRCQQRWKPWEVLA